jgi:preprotein translocase subunit SecG
MYTALIVSHVIITVVMVVVVLLQSGKGGGLGAGFGGGGANTLFGSSGGSNFFTKLTMGLAAAFVVTSLALTAIKSKSMKSSIFDQGNHAAPVTTGAPAATTTEPTNSTTENKAPEAANPATPVEKKQ